MNILVIGNNREVLEKILAGLRAKGIAARGTTEIEKASVAFDAKELALVAFGGGVDLPVRERLKREFKQQNPNVILLDSFAPVAIQHIAGALRGDRAKFASRFEITEHEGSYIVRLDVMKECDVRVEVYRLGDALQAETIVEQHISSGPFEARIDEGKISSGLSMILVTLGGSEFYIHRIEGRGPIRAAQAVRHISASIDRPPEEVYAFASNPENLSQWATGLSGSIENVNGEWIAESPMGKVKIRFAGANTFGVLDHEVVLESGARIWNPMRVVARGNGSEIIFTLFRQPGMSEEKFAEDATWVEKDLMRLKGLLER